MKDKSSRRSFRLVLNDESCDFGKFEKHITVLYRFVTAPLAILAVVLVGVKWSSSNADSFSLLFTFIALGAGVPKVILGQIKFHNRRIERWGCLLYIYPVWPILGIILFGILRPILE